MQLYSDDDKAALSGGAYSWDYGVDVLDDAGTVIDTLDDGLSACTVKHDSYAQVHRTLELETTKAVDWGRVWLRPWQSVTNVSTGYTTPKYHMGAFRAERPKLPMGATPLKYHVTGSDRLSLLLRIVGDSVVSPTGANVRQRIVDLIAASGVPGVVFASTDVASVTLSQALVWIMDAADPDTFLQVINDHGAAAAIRGLYMDGDGNFRLEPYTAPQRRPETWLFDLTDAGSNIVATDRTSTTSQDSGVNYWTFIRQGMATQPTEGAGIYTVDRVGGALPVRKVVQLSAVDQASLEAQGDQIVQTDTTVTQSIDLSMGPLPILEHFDVVGYIDPQFAGAARQHCQIAQWSGDLKAGRYTARLEIPSV